MATVNLTARYLDQLHSHGTRYEVFDAARHAWVRSDTCSCARPRPIGVRMVDCESTFSVGSNSQLRSHP